MQKPETPNLDKLRGMGQGLVRDIFRQANSAAIGAEQRAVDAYERQVERTATADAVQAARAAGLTHLASYRELQQRGRGAEADLYRTMNNRAISDEQAKLAGSIGNFDGPEAA